MNKSNIDLWGLQAISPQSAYRYTLEGFRQYFYSATSTVDRFSANASTTIELILSSFNAGNYSEEFRSDITAEASIHLNTSKFFDKGNTDSNGNWVNPNRKPVIDISGKVSEETVFEQNMKFILDPSTIAEFETTTVVSGERKGETATKSGIYKTIGTNKGLEAKAGFYLKNTNRESVQGFEVEVESPTMKFKGNGVRSKINTNLEYEND